MTGSQISRESPARGFDTAEFETRLSRAQSAMDAAGLDIMMLTTEPEIRYFSGFLTQFWQSPTRPWFLLVPASGKPVAVIPGIGGECMGRTWISDIRTWSSPHHEDDGVSLLAAAIAELGGFGASIGLAMGRESHLRMPLNDFARLKERLVGARFIDATPILSRLRSIKSEAEIGKIRHAAEIASAAFANVPEFVHGGMSEIEVFREFKRTCLSLGADDVAYLVGGAGKGGYGDIISPPSERRLAEGDILILDVGCMWDGYFCDFDRNFRVGVADSASRDAHAIVWQATEAGLAAARPGITCADLFEAMWEVMAPHAIPGAGDVGRLGHGLGMQLTEFPSLTAWDDTELREGMVLTLEPGYAYGEGKMMVHEENIVVRKDGAELLTRRAPKAMPQLGEA